jgi:DNA mismatch repair protein MutS2
MIPLPDLLYPRPTAAVDERLLEELLEVSFLGGEPSADLGDALESVELGASPWRPEFFADGLFLDDLVGRCFALTLGGRRFPLHRRFLRRVLCRPPVAAETIRYRQEVLAELAGDAALRGRAESFYELLFQLLGLFKSPGHGLHGDHAAFRLEILRLVQRVVEAMVDGFGGCTSGLRRLHEVGLEIRASHEHQVLESLLDHEDRLSELTLRVRVGADGRIRHLAVGEVEENVANRFHRGPVRRWWDRTLLRLRGFDVDPREVVNRLIVAVYLEVAPALRALLQVIGPLQVYLGTLAFAAAARERGLEVCRPEIVPAEAGLSLERLFNPLLLRDDEPPPVPCDVAPRHAAATVVVTGPNSGGKTRMLQAVGIAQVLGQAGLLVPARSARVPVLEGLFVSLVEHATADQAEGRLGSELARIRRLFEEVRPGSMVLLDELCSGTNPSEAVEIVSLVLDLLGGLRPVAFITTHFLDYAQQLRESPPYPEVEFLRVVSTEDHVPTYQFTPGVAETSLAVNTARRMGVTFDGLADLLVQRFGIERPVRHGAPGGRET